MNRYKPIGWRYESHRHYLAAKGISTNYFKRKGLKIGKTGLHMVHGEGIAFLDHPELESEIAKKKEMKKEWADIARLIAKQKKIERRAATDLIKKENEALLEKIRREKKSDIVTPNKSTEIKGKRTYAPGLTLENLYPELVPKPPKEGKTGRPYRKKVVLEHWIDPEYKRLQKEWEKISKGLPVDESSSPVPEERTRSEYSREHASKISEAQKRIWEERRLGIRESKGGRPKKS